MPALKKIGAAALSAFGFTSGTSGVTANFLVVAGGAGGGNWTGGGGGAGGYRTSAGTSGGGASAESTISLSLSTSYTVIVGAGGAGGTGSFPPGINGSNSSIGSLITSVGGGGGGGYTPSTYYAPLIGGSGGGGTTSSSATYYTGAAGTANQGYAGGNGQFSGNYPAGGGGGAGAVGGSPATNTSPAGNGGTGVASSISGSSVTYAGGGGGGANSGTAGSGGSGGGGAGSSSGTGSNGSANLGGGGGGCNGASNGGGNGGSGIVIISYTGAQQFGGGVVTTAAGNTIHTFYTSGTLSPINSLSASYLIVAGGGGGGGAPLSYSGSAGGGAGGLLSGSALTIDTNSTYVVSVGAGGAGGLNTGTQGSNGAASSFSMVSTTAVGGGGGGSGSGSNTTGLNGGSGGGSGNSASAGTGTSGQGNNGGVGTNGGGVYGGGGGGGAGQAGFNGTTSVGGNGGNGSSSSISGTATYYAGGGGGGIYSTGTFGTGGLGGGGNGGASGGGNGVAGTVNLGGGGGGGSSSGSVAPVGGAGGSGIVIIAYAGSTQQMAGGSVTITGGNVIHTFTSSGYLTPLTYFGNSLRFRSSASAYLSRTPKTAGNQQKFTISVWLKRGKLGANPVYDWMLYGNDTGGGANHAFFIIDTDQLRLASNSGGATQCELKSTAVYRDPAAWYHMMAAVDTTQATASDRVKLYVNGSQVTSLATATYPSQNANLSFNVATATYIGYYTLGPLYSDDYLSNYNFIDGQQLAPTAFGAFNSYGVWQPITYGGSYGTNGFFLPFNAGAQTYSGSFNGSSQYLSVAQNAAFNLAGGNWTVECWFNTAGNYSDYRVLFAKRVAGSATASYQLYLDISTGVLKYYDGVAPVSLGIVPSANTWHHTACVQNGSTMNVYLDGKLIGSFTNTTTDVTSSFYIGFSGSATEIFSGYISNFRVVKGTAVYTTNFTPSTTPLTAISGTSLLTLQDSTIIDNSTNAFSITNTGSVTTAKDLPLSTSMFNDQSPQGNNWTPNNISGAPGVTLDYMTDVPTLSNATSSNYCVLNPLDKGTSNTLSDGNLQYQISSGNQGLVRSTFAIPTTGKWYCEALKISYGNLDVGIATAQAGLSNYLGFDAYGWGYFSADGNVYNNNNSVGAGGTLANGDIMGIAFDSDNGTLKFYKNNTLQVTVSGFNATTSTYFFAAGSLSGGGIFNFGQQPFTYTPPTGYVALNAYNM